MLATPPSHRLMLTAENARTAQDLAEEVERCAHAGDRPTVCMARVAAEWILQHLAAKYGVAVPTPARENKVSWENVTAGLAGQGMPTGLIVHFNTVRRSGNYGMHPRAGDAVTVGDFPDHGHADGARIALRQIVDALTDRHRVAPAHVVAALQAKGAAYSKVKGDCVRENGTVRVWAQHFVPGAGVRRAAYWHLDGKYAGRAFAVEGAIGSCYLDNHLKDRIGRPIEDEQKGDAGNGGYDRSWQRFELGTLTWDEHSHKVRGYVLRDEILRRDKDMDASA